MIFARCQIETGDGAGCLFTLPDAFLRRVAKEQLGADLPPNGHYALGQIFLPREPELAVSEYAHRKM